jgi:choline dehydrogenase-like flavoprotein
MEPALRWLSTPLEQYLNENPPLGSGFDFDVLIVGSGYGGSVAASQLAGLASEDGQPLRVAVLERGREYLPGQFPSRLADLPAHVRLPPRPGQAGAQGEALLDVRPSADMVVLSACGLGGGSLINAGVMEEARPEVFARSPWPTAIQEAGLGQMRPQSSRGVPDGVGIHLQADAQSTAGAQGSQDSPDWYALARRELLGPRAAPGPEQAAGAHTIDELRGHAGFEPARSDWMQTLARQAPSEAKDGLHPLKARPVPISVALTERPSSAAGLPLERCVACGDCATGCNVGAKQSLDTNLLWKARKARVPLITGATVLKLRAADDDAWVAEVAFSDDSLARREDKPFELRARRVILAAGTLGSTEILMRSREAGLGVSSRLGHGFSGNGDVLAVAVEAPRVLNAVADEDQPLAQRRVGPTITCMIDARESAGLVIQDLAIPGALRAVWEESFALSDTVERLGRVDLSRHWGGAFEADPLSIEPARSARALPVALMGDDGAGGQLVAGEGVASLQVHWPGLKHDPRIARRHDDFQRLLRGQGARVLSNPMWRLLTPDMETALGPMRGPMLTVHPLGGCGMADHPTLGVVNEWGQVFRCAHPRPEPRQGHPGQAQASGTHEVLGDGEVYPTLVVLDGAIIPTALGINPALTITALALRAVDELKRRWRLQAAAPAHRPPPVAGEACAASAPSTEAVIGVAGELGRGSAEVPPRGLVPELPHPARRPVYRRVLAEPWAPSPPTEIEIRERLGGWVRWPTATGEEVKYLEFTFVYQPKALRDLLRPGPQRKLVGDLAQCRLRVFQGEPDPNLPGEWRKVSAKPGKSLHLMPHLEPGDDDALLVWPLSQAELAIFQRGASGPLRRTARGLWAWGLNRGWRDTLQAALDALAGNQAPEPDAPPAWQGIWLRARNAIALASHAGQERQMAYTLALASEPLRVAGFGFEVAPGQSVNASHLDLSGAHFRGLKRIRYTRRGNPWKQLSQISLEGGPWTGLDGRAPVLELDLDYLARQRQPLLRYTRVQDAATGIHDVAALGGYVLRLLLEVHLWTFRKPDAPPARRIERLPGFVPGLPAPEVQEIAVGRWGDAGQIRRPLYPVVKPQEMDRPVMLRLTRYRGRQGGRLPILMIHGYSASGTTFAHHAVQPGAARYFWDQGFDIWVLDMRTSCGMPTATLPWAFEDPAFNDIPVAVDHVLKATGQAKLHVLAHCMGSSMLHMALLEPRRQPHEHFFELRQQLPERIASLAISQVTARMIFSPANTLRAHLMQYLRPMLPLDNYSFRPEGSHSLFDTLLDRLLSSLPYPDEEFDEENPPWPSLRKTPWVGTRHRMDLLYGSDFSPKNVSTEFLHYIDDHFGPLNMDTVAQAIEFARAKCITDWQGAHVYLDELGKSLALLQRFPILSIHGQMNGLCDARSGEWMADTFDRLMPGRYRYRVIAGHGHQDCLVGVDAAPLVFAPLAEFFSQAEGAP